MSRPTAKGNAWEPMVCPVCAGPISVGAFIIRNRLGEWVHPGCRRRHKTRGS